MSDSIYFTTITVPGEKVLRYPVEYDLTIYSNNAVMINLEEKDPNHYVGERDHGIFIVSGHAIKEDREGVTYIIDPLRYERFEQYLDSSNDLKIQALYQEVFDLLGKKEVKKPSYVLFVPDMDFILNLQNIRLLNINEKRYGDILINPMHFYQEAEEERGESLSFILQNIVLSDHAEYMLESPEALEAWLQLCSYYFGDTPRSDRAYEREPDQQKQYLAIKSFFFKLDSNQQKEFLRDWYQKIEQGEGNLKDIQEIYSIE